MDGENNILFTLVLMGQLECLQDRFRSFLTGSWSPFRDEGSLNAPVIAKEALLRSTTIGLQNVHGHSQATEYPSLSWYSGEGKDWESLKLVCLAGTGLPREKSYRIRTL